MYGPTEDDMMRLSTSTSSRAVFSTV